MKVKLIDGNGCTQRLVKLRKAHSPITGHTYSSQLLDNVKSRQQVESPQFLLHNQNLSLNRTPVAHVKLNKSYPRESKGSFTNSEHIHFFPLLRVTKFTSDCEQLVSSQAKLLIPLTCKQFWVALLSYGTWGVGKC